MLTLTEIESTQQFDYELRLEAMGEEALRGLLADAPALRRLIPRHMSDAEGRRIAEATLAELVARQAEVAEPPSPTGPHSAWDPFFALFWTPFR
jgi:hypothetical protein